MEEITSIRTSDEANQQGFSNINPGGEKAKLKTDVEMNDELRERKTSGYFIHEFISRNGWNVEKLPTFHHLHVSELTHGVLDFQDTMHSEFVRQWRRVVTGDPNKYAFIIFVNKSTIVDNTLLGKIIRLSLNYLYSRSPVLLSIFFLQCYTIFYDGNRGYQELLNKKLVMRIHLT